MTVSSTTNRNDYVGNGNVDTYAYTFRIFEDSDLQVTVRDPDTGVETELTLTTHYTVTGAGESGGGNVALVAGAFDWLDAGNDLEVDWALTIRRVLPLTQETDIRNQGPYLPEIHEDQFDRVIMIEQQQDDEIGRSLKLPETVPGGGSFNTQLPGAIAEADAAGRTLIVNDDADGFDLGPTAGEVADAEANALAAQASAAAAAQSAIDALAAAATAQNLFREVVYITGVPSYVIQEADRGKLFVVDTSAGNVSVSLRLVSLIDLSSAFVVGIFKGHASNELIVNTGGTDTIDDGSTASQTFRAIGTGGIYVPSTIPTPDRWTSMRYGLFHSAIAGLDSVNVNPGGGFTLPISDGFNAGKIVEHDLRRRNAVSKTTTATLTTAEEIVLASAASAWTLTLYAAAGNTGKIVRVKKTDANFNAITIDGNASEQITENGVAANTITLNTVGEEVELVCTGTGWQVLRRVIPSFWTTYTPTISNLGTGSATINNARWRRVGDSIEIEVRISKDGSNGSGGSIVGVSVPSGIAPDTSKTNSTNTGNRGGFSSNATVSSNNLNFYYDNAAAVLRWTNGTGNSVGTDFTANSVWTGAATFPVSGWAA